MKGLRCKNVQKLFNRFLIALPFFEILMSRNFQPKQGTIVEPTMERISMCNTNVQ